MMKTFFKILILFLFVPNLSYASSYLLTCVNEKDNFTKNYIVDEQNKIIRHLNSYSPITKQTFSVDKNVEIIFWKPNRIVGYYRFSNAGVPTFMVLNLDKLTKNASGHYAGDRMPYGQLYQCFKSN